jgi:glycerol-3-phosphate acyltransferase PlsY
MILVVLVVASYLVGSIPVAWLITKIVTGQDLRQLGSGNVGVLNTMLSVARWAGVLVFLAEASKGALAVVLARATDAGEGGLYLAVLAAIIGTRWSIWLRGAGGRGNTAWATALLLISWPTLLCVTLVWIVVRVVTHSSFMAMRAMLLLWPMIFGLIARSWWALLFGVAFSVLFMATHRTGTDDHELIKVGYGRLTRFLTTQRRR